MRFAAIFTSLLMPLMSNAAEIPKLIGHRGASANAPENTLASFKMAWAHGADGIEGDFYLTSDNQVVCIHDATTKRTAGTDLKVVSSALAQLKALDVGAWKAPEFKDERIPTLGEVLDTIPAGKWFFLEIKDGVRAVGPILRILTEKKVDPEHVVIISFHADVVAACRKREPKFHASLISELKDFAKEGQPEKYMKELQSCDSTGIAFSAKAPVTKEWLQQAKGDHGVLFAWTVDDAKTAKRMGELGAGFIGTNRPGELRKGD